MTLKINYPKITKNSYIKKLSIYLVNENYLKWINVKQSFIIYSHEYYSIEILRKFFLTKFNKINILFLRFLINKIELWEISS